MSFYFESASSSSDLNFELSSGTTSKLCRDTRQATTFKKYRKTTMQNSESTGDSTAPKSLENITSIELNSNKTASREQRAAITKLVITISGMIVGLVLAISVGIWLVEKRRRKLRKRSSFNRRQPSAQEADNGAVMTGAIASVELEAAVHTTTETAELPAT